MWTRNDLHTIDSVKDLVEQEYAARFEVSNSFLLLESLMSARLSPSFDSIYQRNAEDDELQQEKLTPVPKDTFRTNLHLVSQEGHLQVHTAAYRGSFSSVLSEAIRAAGLGSRVIVAQFLKGGVNQGPQGSVHLCGRLEWLRPAVQGCLRDKASELSSLGDTNEVREAVLEIWAICKQHLLEGKLDQLVLDEVGLAIALGYIQKSEVLATLEKRPEAMDVILTGPSIPTQIKDMADQITELRCGF